jgi:SnoaL-like domain
MGRACIAGCISRREAVTLAVMDTLERLVAMEEIRQLKARYFRHMDQRDWKAMAQVFCRDAHFDCSEGFAAVPLGESWTGSKGPEVDGRDAIMAWIEKSFAGSTSVHHGHCHEITIDSDTEAHGTIAMEDYIRQRDRSTPLVHAAGHYVEQYRIEDGVWRIAATRLTRLFVDRWNGGELIGTSV